MKVVFLDVDGVLNKHRDPPFHICPDRAAKVMRLAQEAGAGIVLSSSWRQWPDAVKRLTDAGFVFVGQTPHTVGRNCITRAEAIIAYLDLHPEVTRYVVLDDDPSPAGHPVLSNRAVLVAWVDGLTDRDVERARTILADGPLCDAPERTNT